MKKKEVPCCKHELDAIVQHSPILVQIVQKIDRKERIKVHSYGQLPRKKVHSRSGTNLSEGKLDLFVMRVKIDAVYSQNMQVKYLRPAYNDIPTQSYSG